MNGVTLHQKGRLDDHILPQIAFGCLCRTDADGMCGRHDGQGILVCLGINHNRLNIHFPAAANDAQRYLSAVRNQNTFEHRKCSYSKTINI